LELFVPIMNVIVIAILQNRLNTVQSLVYSFVFI